MLSTAYGLCTSCNQRHWAAVLKVVGWMCSLYMDWNSLVCEGAWPGQSPGWGCHSYTQFRNRTDVWLQGVLSLLPVRGRSLHCSLLYSLATQHAYGSLPMKPVDRYIGLEQVPSTGPQYLLSVLLGAQLKTHIHHDNSWTLHLPSSEGHTIMHGAIFYVYTDYIPGKPRSIFWPLIASPVLVPPFICYINVVMWIHVFIM